MQTSDFLKRGAQTPLHEFFTTAGAACEIQTNCESILKAAKESFPRRDSSDRAADLRMRFWVDPEGTSLPPWQKPYLRGSGHMIFGGFDSENSLMVDLVRRRVLGRFSPAFGNDRTYWKTVVFPRIVTAVGDAIGVTELHCGCVALAGAGVVLSGNAGAGKSTLTLALAQCGFAFVSEDWTYFSRVDGRVLAWGLPTGIKLLPDAVDHFSQLKRFETVTTLNGERAYKVDPESDFGLRRVDHCEPRWLIFLDREETPGFELSEISAIQAERRLQTDLLAAPPDVRSFQLETIKMLAERGCWRLRFGGSAKAVASLLADFCTSQVEVLASTAAGISDAIANS